MCTVTQEPEQQTFPTLQGCELNRAEELLKAKGYGHDLTSSLSIYFWIFYSKLNGKSLCFIFEQDLCHQFLSHWLKRTSGADFRRARRKSRILVSKHIEEKLLLTYSKDLDLVLIHSLSLISEHGLWAASDSFGQVQFSESVLVLHNLMDFTIILIVQSHLFQISFTVS